MTQAQTELLPDTNQLPPIDYLDGEDVIDRGLRNVLPVKLTKEEYSEIAHRRTVVEKEYDELEADLKKETDKRKADLKTREEDIARMRRWLHANEQERSVRCANVFRCVIVNGQPTGWVVTLRLDTGKEVTRVPATPKQLQRYLPSDDLDPSKRDAGDEPRPLLEQARAAQAAADGGESPATTAAAGGDGGGEGDGDGPDDDADPFEEEDDDASKAGAEANPDAKPKRGSKPKAGAAAKPKKPRS